MEIFIGTAGMISPGWRGAGIQAGQASIPASEHFACADLTLLIHADQV
jgi:hypothetical protein